MVQNIIFDVDGTLVDSVDAHAACWQETFAHFGKSIASRSIREHVGMGGDLLVKLFFSPDELRRLEKSLDRYHDHLFQSRYLKTIRGFPGVRELFERLSLAGKSVALASSAKKPELDHYKQLLGIGTFLNGETSADDAEATKPAPDIFQAAMRQLPFRDPRQTLVIGDSPYDMVAARHAQLASIGVLSGKFAPGALLAAGCQRLFRDPADLLNRWNFNQRQPLY